MILLLIWGICSVAANGQTVRVDASSTEVITLLEYISAQAKIRYAINSRDEAFHKRIRLKPGHYSLPVLLAEIEKQAQLKGRRIEDHLVFSRVSNTSTAPGRPIQKQVKTAVAEAGTSKAKTTGTARPSHSIVLQKTIPAYPVQAAQLVVAVPDHHTTAPQDAVPVQGAGLAKPVWPLSLEILPGSDVKSSSQVISGNPDMHTGSQQAGGAASKNSRERYGISIPPLQLFARAGLAANEAIYMNAVVQAGLPVIYGIASWGTNFTTSGFRYGLGSSISLSQHASLHASFTTGLYQRSSTYTLDTLTTHYDLNQRERLNEYGLAWEKTTGNWHFQVQLHYSTLTDTTRYGGPRPPDPGTSLGTPASGTWLIKPPYNFGTTKNNAYTQRAWIGIQLSLFYTLSFRQR